MLLILISLLFIIGKYPIGSANSIVVYCVIVCANLMNVFVYGVIKDDFFY